MEQEAPTGPAQPGRFIIKGQYVKDLSFENPHAPQSLLALNDKPKIDVAVDIQAQKLQEGLYELILKIRAQANIENNVLFIVDLAYAGIFQMHNIPKELMERVVLVECPFVIFPFARRVIADVTRDGGFPPLMLDPIDFVTLYNQNREKILKKA